MKHSKNSKEIYELAEKISLNNFDKSNKKHEFSNDYKRKKKLFLEEVKIKNK